jgi:hypothetical protein
MYSKFLASLTFCFHRTRAVSLAAQKFIADIAHEALQHSKMRIDKDKRKDRRLVLTTEDLAVSLQTHGIDIRKPATAVQAPQPE